MDSARINLTTIALVSFGTFFSSVGGWFRLTTTISGWPSLSKSPDARPRAGLGTWGVGRDWSVMSSKTSSARFLDGWCWLPVGLVDVGAVHLGGHMAICQHRSTNTDVAGEGQADGRDGDPRRAGRVGAAEGRVGAVRLSVWLVRVLKPPPGETGLEWLLLSRDGGATAEWATRLGASGADHSRKPNCGVRRAFFRKAGCPANTNCTVLPLDAGDVRSFVNWRHSRPFATTQGLRSVSGRLRKFGYSKTGITEEPRRR